MSIKKEVKQVKKVIKKEVKQVEKVIKDVEEEVKQEIQYAEKWMHERRKFLIKLGWVLGFITVLLILSEVYLRVKGFR